MRQEYLCCAPSGVNLCGVAFFCTAFDAHTLWRLGYPEQAHASMVEGLAQAQTLWHPFRIALALDYVAMLHQFCQDTLSTQEGVYGWFSEGFETTDLQQARTLLQALAEKVGKV